MEIRQIELDGQIVEYQLNVKSIKRLYIKVVSGKLIVNCSPVFSIKDIEQLIYDNKDKILKLINGYKSKFEYIDGGYVYIFNFKYEILVRDINRRQVTFHDKRLYVYHRQVQKTVEDELKNILFDYINDRISLYLKNDFKLKMPKIEIKKLKSRWGACYSNNNKVIFNLALVHLDKELIDYVIVHELCHFLQPNHSKLFYFEVEKRLPDYCKREKKLKEIGI